MTEFKKGDRVKVEFEGEVTGGFNDGGLYVRPRGGGMNFVADGANITLLEHPVEPLAVGTAVYNPSDREGLWLIEPDRVRYLNAYDGIDNESQLYSLESLSRKVAAGDFKTLPRKDDK